MPTEGLAAERTALAWVRTVLAVLGAGLIIGRLAASGLPIPAAILDCVIIGAGAFALRDSYDRYRRRGEPTVDGRAPAVLAVLVVLLGLVAAAVILVVER